MNGFWGGVIGSVLVMTAVFVLFVWKCPFNYRSVVIVEQTTLQNNERPSITIPEQELMQSLRDKGYLLTPAEYTNNLVGYYNTLIAVLAIFFLVFSIFSYVSIRNSSKKEVRDEARELLKDSEFFRKAVTNTLKSQFDSDYVLADIFEQRMKDAEENIAVLIDEKNTRRYGVVSKH